MTLANLNDVEFDDVQQLHDAFVLTIETYRVKSILVMLLSMECRQMQMLVKKIKIENNELIVNEAYKNRIENLDFFVCNFFTLLPSKE